MFQVPIHLRRGTATTIVPVRITARQLNIFGGDIVLIVEYAREDQEILDLKANSSICANLNY